MEDLSRTHVSHHGKRDFEERNQVENQVYATVFPVLAKYESPGFNPHNRSQTIAREVGDRCEEFVRDSMRGAEERFQFRHEVLTDPEAIRRVFEEDEKPKERTYGTDE